MYAVPIPRQVLFTGSWFYLNNTHIKGAFLDILLSLHWSLFLKYATELFFLSLCLLYYRRFVQLQRITTTTAPDLHLMTLSVECGLPTLLILSRFLDRFSNVSYNKKIESFPKNKFTNKNIPTVINLQS